MTTPKHRAETPEDVQRWARKLVRGWPPPTADELAKLRRILSPPPSPAPKHRKA